MYMHAVETRLSNAYLQRQHDFCVIVDHMHGSILSITLKLAEHELDQLRQHDDDNVMIKVSNAG